MCFVPLMGSLVEGGMTRDNDILDESYLSMAVLKRK